MEAKEIVTIPNKILRTKAAKVVNFDVRLQNLGTKMVRMMRESDGVGLAAPQIGVSQRMIVVEYNPREDDKNRDKPFPLMILVNPTVTKFSSEKVNMLEGCLSLPGLEIEVSRPKEVNVTAQDLDGKSVKIRAKGLLARVLQHEIDHLNGVLFTDHVKDVKNWNHYKDLRVVFMGTPSFAVIPLDALIVNGINVVGVITETDKPVGRKQEMTSPEVKVSAEEFGIPVYQPKDKAELERITAELKPDYIVVGGFGRILSKKVLEIPPFGIINIHPSKLPKYRGATPVQNTILNGDENTAVSIMKIDERMDEGDIIFQKDIAVEEDDTTESLTKRLWVDGAKLLLEVLPLYLSNQIEPIKQDHTKASYTKMLKKEDGEIEWSKSPEEIERMVRAYNPWPRAFTFLDGKRLIIHSALVVNGKLVPEIVQPEGGKMMNWDDFKRGFQGNMPEKLG